VDGKMRTKTGQFAFEVISRVALTGSAKGALADKHFGAGGEAESFRSRSGDVTMVYRCDEAAEMDAFIKDTREIFEKMKMIGLTLANMAEDVAHQIVIEPCPDGTKIFVDGAPLDLDRVKAEGDRIAEAARTGRKGTGQSSGHGSAPYTKPQSSQTGSGVPRKPWPQGKPLIGKGDPMPKCPQCGGRVSSSNKDPTGFYCHGCPMIWTGAIKKE